MTAKPMTTRSARLAAGAAGQAELKTLLEKEGFRVVETGQESWLPDDVHERFRLDHDDPMVRTIRYQPDLLAFNARWRPTWWDAKVNATPGTPNFSLELACYQEQMARMSIGQRVVLAFKDTDGRWFAQWVEELEVVDDHSERRHQARGSRTPYLLIAKRSTESLLAFLAFRNR